MTLKSVNELTWLSHADAQIAAAGLVALIDLTDRLTEIGVTPIRNRSELQRIANILEHGNP